MTIEGKAVLVTGAARGLGQALVNEALDRGAARVYAGMRQPVTHPDARVTTLALDITDTTQVQEATQQVNTVDILINNAGLAIYDDVFNRPALEQQLAVNLFGTFDVTKAFLPQLTQSQGTIVNVVSLAAWGAIPLLPGYSISKAAMFSLSQALRAVLAGQGVSVHSAILGPVDTDMVRVLPIPKSTPASVAAGIFDGMEKGVEDIFPDPLSETIADGWRNGAVKALERENAKYLPQAAQLQRCSPSTSGCSARSRSGSAGSTCRLPHRNTASCSRDCCCGLGSLWRSAN
jgi:NAD(P)-dependent dehydrogenase (short-subunit alcohol dehydrogenase family)